MLFVAMLAPGWPMRRTLQSFANTRCALVVGFYIVNNIVFFQVPPDMKTAAHKATYRGVAIMNECTTVALPIIYIPASVSG